MLVKNKTTKVINKNIIHYLSILPKNIVKTITFDRGKEFANWQQLEKKVRCENLFCKSIFTLTEVLMKILMV
ncbi:hypothetical protein SHM_01010 [Spiroplasma ixodetis]|uniref:IS30 family transposase n=2 Tax=Spiroplasma ixodetis TaxID=2141 RepID=A0ABM8BRI7_9MOLU|nr:hypothetical protein SHM_01010 [Spiroplasma ixodetis]